MNNTLILLFVLLLCCHHQFDNPSDSKGSDYTVYSEAVLSIADTGEWSAGDSLRFFGGVTSETVEKAALVNEYQWDFDSDGNVDTVLLHAETLVVVYQEEGTYTCRLVCTDKAEFRDSAEVKVRIKERTGKKRQVVIVSGAVDTVYLTIESRTDTIVITESGDSLHVVANDNGDSIGVISRQGDTLHVGPIDGDTLTIEPVNPDTGTTITVRGYIPDFPNIPGFPDVADEECAFFAEDSSLMRTTLNCYDVMWEQTRKDGYETLDFISRMIIDIVGLPFIGLFDSKYEYTFENGVYRFFTGDFTVSIAFHYGQAAGAHDENDTVVANIFSIDSYVSGVETSLTPPLVTYKKGPLFDLIDGEVSLDGSGVTFAVDVTRLKVSFYRMSVHDLASFPLGIVNDTVTLQMRHESQARMEPVFIKDFGELFHEDSIIVDHGGTVMDSKPVALNVVYAADSGYTSSEYQFTLRQEMITQKTAYGDNESTLKLSGFYDASATLGFDDFDQDVFFTGRYSSSVSDSSWFYCDEDHEDIFGTLFFNEADSTIGVFQSDKFGYEFPYTPLIVKALE